MYRNSMIKRRTLSKIFEGQVRNTGGTTFTARCYAERGSATVSRPSVRPSVRNV